MKYEPQDYARSFLEVYDGFPKRRSEIIRRFLLLLKKNGDFIRLPKILQALERLLLKKRGCRKILLESARPLPASSLGLIRRAFQPADIFEIRIRPSLAAGIRVVIDEEQELDLTLERRLRQMFRQS